MGLSRVSRDKITHYIGEWVIRSPWVPLKKAKRPVIEKGASVFPPLPFLFPTSPGNVLKLGEEEKAGKLKVANLFTFTRKNTHAEILAYEGL